MWLWRFIHRYHVTILTVHGVMDRTNRVAWWPLRSQMSPVRLEACLRFLSRYYQFVPLKDAVEMVTGLRPVRPYSLSITFDDGYRSHVKYALPILRRHGITATFFLAAGHVEHRRPFWFDRLDYALQHASVDGRQVQIGPRTVRLSAESRSALRDSYKKLRDVAKALDRCDLEMLRDMENMAAMFEQQSGRRLTDIFEDDDWSAVLTWADVRAVASCDLCFGSHTVDHVRLGLVDTATITDQLVRSKQMIEAQTHQPCLYLCYPNGSFTEEVAQIARSCGYEAALTTIEGTNRRGDDPMTLRRIDLPEHGGVAETLAIVSGLSASIARVKGTLLTLWPGRTHRQRRESVAQ